MLVLENSAGSGWGVGTNVDELASIAEATGTEVDLPLHAFSDLEANLAAQVERIRSHPWIKDVPVTGLIYEVETGRLRRVA